ncbi:unnamed protein product [Rhizoctonia solani]|uniref:Uncharacterized protein n=1 Tax=Rhizoctonia solani TaxID=456999 RepID=A0A8H3HDM8_9AGAM|nr:unnamed protein product [Rhizoctonia solani]
MGQSSRETSEGVGIGEAIPVQDPEIWQTALAHLDKLTNEGRTADAEDIERAAETSGYLVGHAVVRFIGPGEINGVLNTDQEPDERHNPRGLNPEHVQNLSEIFSRGHIKDRVSPIRIKVPPDSIDESLLKKMREANPSDPKSSIPTLELKRSTAVRERQLEKEILYHSDGERLLSDSEVQQRRDELRELRAARPLARLLNGNHRINAMIRATKLLRQRASEIINAERNKEENILEQWLELNERIKKATYTVEVYKHDTPDYILAWLAENEEQRPNYAPRAGEKLWSIIDSQEAMVRYLQRAGIPERTAALNKIMEVIQRRTPTKDIGDATILAAMQGLRTSSQKKGNTNEISDESIAQLILHPAMNAMVVDTSRALWVYNERIMDSHIHIMRKDLGAPLIGHYWMSIRLLLKISNVARGVGLEQAEKYLEGVERVASKSMRWAGYAAAEEHWANLHKNPQRTPALLTRYGDEQVAAFDRFFREEMNNKGGLSSGNYEDPGYISALRRIFLAFGKVQNGPSEYARRFSASIRLYALLPLWSEGCNDDRFFPAALLPNRQCVASYAKQLKNGSDTPGLWVLETLLDKHQLGWTAGTVGNSSSQNSNNWTGRARGTHQILMRLTQSRKLGGRDAQLQTAMNLFDSPFFFASLSAVDKYLGNGPESRLNQLKHECSARKSTIGDFPILRQIVSRLGVQMYGTVREVREKLDQARGALRTRLFKEDGPLDNILQEHPVLQVIPMEWWENFDIWAWAHGWNDPPAKWMNTTAFLLAWGLITNEVVSYIVPEVITKVPATRHLLKAVRSVTSAEETEPWWHGLKAYQTHSNVDDGESEKDELEEEEGEGDGHGRHGHGQTERVEQGKGAQKSQEGREKAAQKKVAKEPPQVRNCDNGDQQSSKLASNVSPRKTQLVVLMPPPKSVKAHSALAPALARPSASGPSPRPLDPHLLSRVIASPPRPTKAPRGHLAEPLIASSALTNEGSLTGGQALHSGLSSTLLPAMSQGKTTGKNKEKEIAPAREVEEEAPVSNFFGLVRRQAPPYIRIYTSTLADTPGNIMLRQEHEHAQGNESENSAVGLELDGAIRRAPQLMLEINKHRLHLRQSLHFLVSQVARPFSEFPFALEYSVAGLVRDVALCRDIYVSRVARSFQAVYGCSPEEGMAEAVLMARTDGLYENSLVTLDSSSGTVNIDFRWTLARGNQQKADTGERPQFVREVSKLPGDPDELEKAVKSLDRFMPVHGYGHSLSMIEERGVLGAALMAGNQLLQSHDPPRAMVRNEGAVVSLAYDARGTDQANSFCEMMSQGPSYLEKLRGWSIKEFKGSGAIPEEYQSPWSTGIFDAPLDHKSCETNHSGRRPVLASLESNWAEAQNLDMEGYTNDLHIIGGPLPTMQKGSMVEIRFESSAAEKKKGEQGAPQGRHAERRVVRANASKRALPVEAWQEGL